MKKETTLIELRCDHITFWDCFYKLATVCELNYHYLKCPVSKKSSIKGHEYVHGDIAVSTEQLQKIITEATQHK